MSTKTTKVTDTAKVAHTAKRQNASIATSHKTNDDSTSRQASAKTMVTKRVTTEEINKANALMMKAWDMISQRQQLEVDG